ncbi:class E sortase [Virgisporangium aliadipatigenens]|uniref:class E sortase n=1 Tax=Virgisporangium aliadipatigenens TaxID=741659 RepID=UPI001EF16B23|nr:class E sortase [Virgisporangium aliadipatigenens]
MVAVPPADAFSAADAHLPGDLGSPGASGPPTVVGPTVAGPASGGSALGGPALGGLASGGAASGGGAIELSTSAGVTQAVETAVAPVPPAYAAEPAGVQVGAPDGAAHAALAESTTILPVLADSSLADLGLAPPRLPEPRGRRSRRSRKNDRIEADSAKNTRDGGDLGDDGDGATITVLKPIAPEDRTAIIPRISPEDDLPEDDGGRPSAAPKGVKVIPLRPVRTGDGYKSVFVQFTRTTPATMLRAFARGTGEVLITFGLIVLLFAAYEVWGKAAIVAAEQGNLDKQLAQDWGQSPGPSPSASSGPQPPPALGEPFAKLYIPRMGKHWVINQGVRPSDIKHAPGHYPDTVMPGEIGNFSVAGHRTPSIFWDMDKIQLGDAIVVETKQNWYVYSVKQSHVVLPTAVQVVAPVPNQPGAAPTTAMLTLTTCNPKYNNYQRLIVHAELIRSSPHDSGQPRELES